MNGIHANTYSVAKLQRLNACRLYFTCYFPIRYCKYLKNHLYPGVLIGMTNKIPTAYCIDLKKNHLIKKKHRKNEKNILQPYTVSIIILVSFKKKLGYRK